MGVLIFPLRGLLWLAEEVASRVDRVLYDEEGLRAELLRLNAALDAGAIREDEFACREEALVQRLAQARAHHRAARSCRAAGLGLP
jgi:hypothetical protein